MTSEILTFSCVFPGDTFFTWKMETKLRGNFVSCRHFLLNTSTFMTIRKKSRISRTVCEKTDVHLFSTPLETDGERSKIVWGKINLYRPRSLDWRSVGNVRQSLTICEIHSRIEMRTFQKSKMLVLWHWKWRSNSMNKRTGLGLFDWKCSNPYRWFFFKIVAILEHTFTQKVTHGHTYTQRETGVMTTDTICKADLNKKIKCNDSSYIRMKVMLSFQNLRWQLIAILHFGI